MIREINDRMYKINTHASTIIVAVDDFYDSDVQSIVNAVHPICMGYKVNLLVYLAKLTLKGYAVSSVTEFNADGSKPKISYAKDRDFLKILEQMKGDRR